MRFELVIGENLQSEIVQILTMKRHLRALFEPKRRQFTCGTPMFLPRKRSMAASSPFISERGISGLGLTRKRKRVICFSLRSQWTVKQQIGPVQEEQCSKISFRIAFDWEWFSLALTERCAKRKRQRVDQLHWMQRRSLVRNFSTKLSA
jgi:hypothetical protein